MCVFLYRLDITNLLSKMRWVPKDSIGLDKQLAKVQKGPRE